jgi:hypothetical protein
MKRTSGRVLLFTVTLAVAVATSVHPTAASTRPPIDWHKVHAATLTARQITTASGTGYTAQTMGVNCTLRGPQGAIACWQKYPHSDGADGHGASGDTRKRLSLPDGGVREEVPRPHG